MAAFIASRREQHGIPAVRSCRALGVSQAWFYKWLQHANAGTLPPRQQRRRELAAKIAQLFAEHKGRRGSPVIAADLRDAGWRVSANTVAALMAGQGLAARPRKRRRPTTRPGKGRWRAPDLVRRQFPAAKINREWYGDHTEIVTDQGKLHLAPVMDAASRRMPGFSLSQHHDADNGCGALAMAVRGGDGDCLIDGVTGPTRRV